MEHGLSPGWGGVATAEPQPMHSTPCARAKEHATAYMRSWHAEDATPKRLLLFTLPIVLAIIGLVMGLSVSFLTKKLRFIAQNVITTFM